MSSVKQMLKESIEALSDEEARYLLAIAKDLVANRARGRVRESILEDVRFPSIPRSFENVEPIRGKGKPASELLVEERR